MKAYLSFSHEGYKKIDTDLINLHKTAFYSLKKHFNEVYFYTDYTSEKYFKDIPWTKVFLDLEEIKIKDKVPELWSAPKIFAYKKIAEKGDPFIHIDYDVILWKRLPERILNADVFTQCPEDVRGHGYHISKILGHCPNLYYIEDKQPIYAYNMGIFGGKDVKFIHTYAEKSLEFIFDKKNENFWKNFTIGNNTSLWKSSIAEQYFLAAIAETFDKKIDCLFNSWPSEEECERLGYTHLMIDKNKLIVKEKIKDFLKNYEKNN